MSEKDLEIQQLREEIARLQAEKAALLAEHDEMKAIINDLRAQMAWFRKKFFGSTSEKHLPLDPNVLEPTLFDTQLSEDEQAKLDADVKAMEEENARVIEVTFRDGYRWTRLLTTSLLNPEWPRLSSIHTPFFHA